MKARPAETITVRIPTDGSIPPCERCGSITVDLDGNPKPCSLHRFCPPCGGGERDTLGPQYCPIHECRQGSEHEWIDRGYIYHGHSCGLQRGHEGPHQVRGWWPPVYYATPGEAEIVRLGGGHAYGGFRRW